MTTEKTMIRDAANALKGPSFSLEPFASIIQPIIEAVLIEHKKNKYRKGTILTPLIMVWLVLSLTLRRDINYHGTLNWMLSGFRWLQLDFPSKIVKDGAISHARVKMGVDIFRCIFYKFVSSFNNTAPDFHKLTTVIFDGTTMKMPDTKSNLEKFGKHKSGRGFGAFPQLRVVALLALSARRIIDIAYAPIKGKKTGEKTLMFEILKNCKGKNILFLFDAGFYSFYLAWYMMQHGHDFIIKVATTVKLKSGSQLPDGSYLSVIKGKVEDPVGSTNGRKKWNKVDICLRVICFQIRGFRPVRLITSIVDPNITAREIIIHYHKRWDIEISFSEIKTYQCATLRGQAPTILRSKRSDLVEQELYAILIMYNLIRSVIYEAASKEAVDPLLIGFLDVMQLITESAPNISSYGTTMKKKAILYLYKMVADSLLDRPRRPRSNPRVVKIKMSNFKRKRKKDKSVYINYEDEVQTIIPMAA